LHAFGWAALAVLGTYLALFFWGGAQAAQAVGRPIWVFGVAKGRDRLAALGFRAAFALAAGGPLVWLALPTFHKLDPLWTEGRLPLHGFLGVALAALGAMLAFAAQMAMGASWRVGVKEGETGALVRGGLFHLSRNPTFLGQLVLLIGVVLAIPSMPTLVAAGLFFWSASVQIRSEEVALSAANGAHYEAFRRAVPRWIGWPREGVQ
jgi:protein-S-isoprenylcysteine O-methyltransferase Ste14